MEKSDGSNRAIETGYSAKRSAFRQVLVGLVAVSGAISSGLILGFSAVSLPQLTSPDNEDGIFLDTDQASWFASLSAILSPIGCLLCGPLLDRFGRKACLLLNNIPCMIGWLLLATAEANAPGVVAQLYCGRIFGGLAIGMASIPGTVYLSEIASNNKIRSMMVSWTSVGIAFGILLVYILGAIFQNHWRIVAIICAVLPIISFLITFLALPESPLWLINKNELEKAMNSLKFLRGVNISVETHRDIQIEFDVMIQSKMARDAILQPKSEEKQNPTIMTIENNRDTRSNDTSSVSLTNIINKQPKSNCLATIREKYRLLRRPEAFKPLLIMNGLFFFQQLSGIYVVIFYAVDILIKAGVTIDEYLATVLLGLVQFLAGIAVSLALKRCGRRPMSIASGIGMALSLISLGLYLQFDGQFSWFPLLAMLAFVIFGMIGFHTLPWALLGEMYPMDIKGVAAGITTCFAYIFSFLSLKLYPTLFHITNSEMGIFYFYGVVSVLATVFVFFFLPETHKKSLQQIQEEFTK